MHLYRRLIWWLLWLANAKPPLGNRAGFYALKQRLCACYGRYDADDVQHIMQPCWACEGVVSGGRCWKCQGTGIYSERWIRLERWQVGPYLFHRPTDSTSIAPTKRYSFGGALDCTRPVIEGYITHPHRGRLSDEARLWLYLLCGEGRLWWQAMQGWSCGRYLWPMLLLQWLIAHGQEWARCRRCGWCHRCFWTWGRGGLVCKRCRTPQRAEATEEAEDEIPF